MFELFEIALPNVSLHQVASLTAAHFGLEGTLTRLGGERNLNVKIETGDQSFTVKVTNLVHDEVPAVVAALRHIESVDPQLPVPRVVETVGGEPWTAVSVDGVDLRMSAFTHLPGKPVPLGPLDSDCARAIGAMLGRLQQTLHGFIHRGAVRKLLWDARNAAGLLSWAASISDPKLRSLVEGVLTSSSDLAWRIRPLPAQVIHHDFNRNNLLTAPADPTVITGVLDFGDMVHAARIQDIAVATAYSILDHPAPIQPAAALLGGFQEWDDVTVEEVAVLRELVSIRLAQSLAISWHRSQVHPDNAEYILIDARSIAATLDHWVRLDPAMVDAELHSAAGFIEPGATAELETRRSASLWSGLRTMYSPPLHLVRGDGVWLDDRSGRQYLDAYNNVPQVGHGNRRVIAAATAQARRLNTNTRYLTDTVVALAEAITARLPDPLSVCLFVSSGSEATDLAWRIARTVTGHRGAITTSHAYHGWTEAIYAISPEERPAELQPSWHRTIAPPHDDGAAVTEALHRLRSAGHEPAAIWFDTTFSSDGIADPHASYLDNAVAAVRSAGGIYIADEVQGGLGRVGTRYWGFAAGTAIPDIVTLGKPLGNGYPIGAVVTTPEIAERFAHEGYFFSTFGGNPMSAAAALMVLRITDELDLPGRAATVGDALRHDLADILRPLTGSCAIRGAGAFVGADVGDAAAAAAFVEAMRGAGVLVSRTGPGGSVVKIRPPLVFDLEHAERLLEAAGNAVREVSTR